MTDKLATAFQAADRLPPAVQDELADRILAEVLDDPMADADRLVDALQAAARTLSHARFGPPPCARG